MKTPENEEINQMIAEMTNDEFLVLLDILEDRDRFMEKRRYNRISYRVSVELAGYDAVGQCELRDISIGGLFLLVDTSTNSLLLGQDIAVKVPHPRMERFINVHGRIIRATMEGVGVEFGEEPVY